MSLGPIGPVIAFLREDKCSQLQEFSNVTYDSATAGKEDTFKGLGGGGAENVPVWHLQKIPTVFTW